MVEDNLARQENQAFLPDEITPVESKSGLGGKGYEYFDHRFEVVPAENFVLPQIDWKQFAEHMSDEKVEQDKIISKSGLLVRFIGNFLTRGYLFDDLGGDPNNERRNIRTKLAKDQKGRDSVLFKATQENALRLNKITAVRGQVGEFLLLDSFKNTSDNKTKNLMKEIYNQMKIDHKKYDAKDRDGKYEYIKNLKQMCFELLQAISAETEKVDN
jgi:hypothetical protein